MKYISTFIVYNLYILYMPGLTSFGVVDLFSIEFDSTCWILFQVVNPSHDSHWGYPNIIVSQDMTKYQRQLSLITLTEWDSSQLYMCAEGEDRGVCPLCKIYQPCAQYLAALCTYFEEFYVFFNKCGCIKQTCSDAHLEQIKIRRGKALLQDRDFQ